MNDTLQAKVTLTIDNQAVSQQLEKTKTQLKQRLSTINNTAGATVGGAIKKNMESSITGMGSILTRIGRNISNTIEKSLKIGLTFVGGSIAAYLSTGTAGAERFKDKLSDLKTAYASLGEKILKLKFGGKDTYEWVDILSEKINNIDSSKLQNIADVLTSIASAAVKATSNVIDFTKGAIGDPYSKKIKESSFKPVLDVFDKEQRKYDISFKSAAKASNILKAFPPVGSLLPLLIYGGQQAYRGYQNVGKNKRIEEAMKPYDVMRSQIFENPSLSESNKGINDLRTQIEIQKKGLAKMYEQFLASDISYVGGKAPLSERLGRAPEIQTQITATESIIGQLEEALTKSPLNENLKKTLTEQKATWEKLKTDLGEIAKDFSTSQEERTEFEKNRADIMQSQQELTSKYEEAKNKKGVLTLGTTSEDLPNLMAKSIEETKNAQVEAQKETNQYLKDMKALEQKMTELIQKSVDNIRSVKEVLDSSLGFQSGDAIN